MHQTKTITRTKNFNTMQLSNSTFARLLKTIKLEVIDPIDEVYAFDSTYRFIVLETTMSKDDGFKAITIESFGFRKSDGTWQEFDLTPSQYEDLYNRASGLLEEEWENEAAVEAEMAAADRDAEAYRKDPYSYNGVSRADFI